MTMSPTQLSLRHLRSNGWSIVEVVEHWNPHAGIRQDLFGFIDVLAVKPGETLAVQTTSLAGVSARIRKIAEHPNTPAVREAGWRSTVEYHANGDVLANGEKRDTFDRGGNGYVNGNRVTANRVAPDDWSDCGHNTWRRGIVLDPFAGSGTTLVAASELGRDSIGIDIDERNLDLARERCGMFLIEEEVTA